MQEEWLSTGTWQLIKKEKLGLSCLEPINQTKPLENTARGKGFDKLVIGKNKKRS